MVAEGPAAQQGITNRSLPIVDQGCLAAGRAVSAVPAKAQYPVGHGEHKAVGMTQVLSTARSAPRYRDAS